MNKFDIKNVGPVRLFNDIRSYGYFIKNLKTIIDSMIVCFKFDIKINQNLCDNNFINQLSLKDIVCGILPLSNLKKDIISNNIQSILYLNNKIQINYMKHKIHKKDLFLLYKAIDYFFKYYISNIKKVLIYKKALLLRNNMKYNDFRLLVASKRK